MANELSRFNRVRYTLFSDVFGVLIIPEPEGWNDDQKELLRSTKYHGINKNFSGNLRFYGSAFSALKSVYDIQGIKGNVRLEREERNEQTDVWEPVYTSYLDFSQYKQEDNYITVKLNESDFFKLIESKFKEKLELDRLTDLKNNIINPFQWDKVQFDGRDILRETLFDNQGEIVRVNYRGAVDFTIPLNKIYSSDESFFSPTAPVNSSGYLDLNVAKIIRGFSNRAHYNAGTLYYLVAERNRTINFNLRLKFRYKATTPLPGKFATLRVYRDLVKKEGDDYVSHAIDQTLLLFQASFFTEPNGIVLGEWKEVDLDINFTHNLLETDSLGLRFQPFFSAPYLEEDTFQFEFNEIYLLAQENDLGTRTEIEACTLFKAFERLLTIITGKNCFQSSLLQSGYWQYLYITNGFKIRKNPVQTLTTSLEELWEAINTIDDVALFIENRTVKLELKNQAYIPQVGVDLGEVVKIKRKIDEKLHFSSIEIGYDFNGEYEEVNGLDEFNIKNLYQTCIDVIDNPYKSISKVRADAYGMTLAQQKPYNNNPKEDTKYDKFNFFLDCKLDTENQQIVLRKWQDDFDNEPTGIYSPQSAFNLRLSPFNCLLRKGRFLSTGLQKYPTELITYASTEGNSQLVTLYPERANVPNSILPAPYFLPEEIEFDKKTSMRLFFELIKNPTKMYKFVNEVGNEEYAYLISVKPNKEGKYITIKANF